MTFDGDLGPMDERAAGPSPASAAGGILALFLGLGWVVLGMFLVGGWWSLAAGLAVFVAGSITLGGSPGASAVTAWIVYAAGVVPFLGSFAGRPVPLVAWVVGPCHALAGTLLLFGARAARRRRTRAGAAALGKVFD